MFPEGNWGILTLARHDEVIDLAIEERRLRLDVSDEVLRCRLAEWRPGPGRAGGYQEIYVQHVMRTSTRADFDFLVGSRINEVLRESH